MRDFLKSKGFSLMELMIALGVGSVVTLGVMGTFKQKSQQDAAIKRDSDISSATSYLNTVFTNKTTFQNVVANLGPANVGSPLNGPGNGTGGISFGGSSVLANGSAYGKIIVGPIVLDEIKPLASSTNTNGTKPGLVVISATFTPTQNGNKNILGGAGAKTSYIKLMVGLDNNNIVQGFISDTDSRTISLAQSCGNMTGADSNWLNGAQDMKLIDPYDDDISDGLTEITVNSAKGKCQHEFFKRTCEDFNRSGLVNSYNDEPIVIDHIKYQNDETLDWNQRCENAPEVMCIALGKRWINGKCYDTCLADGTECGIKAPGGNSCGRCCNRPSCCNGDLDCHPNAGATCECNYCGMSNSCTLTAGSPPPAPAAPAAAAPAAAAPAAAAPAAAAPAAAAPAAAAPAAAAPAPPSSCTPTQIECIYESLSPAVFCSADPDTNIIIGNCNADTGITQWSADSCACKDGAKQGATVTYQGNSCDSGCNPYLGGIILSSGSSGGSSNTSSGGSSCIEGATCTSSADCDGSSCVAGGTDCITYTTKNGNCNMVNPAASDLNNCENTYGEGNCACLEGGTGAQITQACIADVNDTPSVGQYSIVYGYTNKTCVCD